MLLVLGPAKGRQGTLVEINTDTYKALVRVAECQGTCCCCTAATMCVLHVNQPAACLLSL